MLLTLPPLCISAVAEFLPPRDLAALACTHPSLVPHLGQGWTTADVVLRSDRDADLFEAWLHRMKPRLQTLMIKYDDPTKAVNPGGVIIRGATHDLPPLPHPEDLTNLTIEYGYPVVMTASVIEWMRPLTGLSALDLDKVDFGKDVPASPEVLDIWKTCVSRLSSFSYTPGEDILDNGEVFHLYMCRMPDATPHLKSLSLGQLDFEGLELPTSPLLSRLELYDCGLLMGGIEELWPEVPPVSHLKLNCVFWPVGQPSFFGALGPTLRQMFVYKRVDEEDAEDEIDSEVWDEQDWMRCLEGTSLEELYTALPSMESSLVVRKALLTIPEVFCLEFKTNRDILGIDIKPEQMSYMTVAKFVR